MSTDAHAEHLYDGAPSTFVARRDQLVRDLRAAGRRAEADAAKALRRPTAAAAAVNDLARARPELVVGVLAAADDLARTQRRALSGLPDADVRGAVRAHHAALAAAVAATGSQPAGVADAVRSTLLAAGLDEEVADAVRRGVLATAADPPDASEALLMSAPLSAVGTPRRQPAPADEPAVAEVEADDARRATQRAEATREAARREAMAAIAEAERQVARARSAQVAAARRHRAAAEEADAGTGRLGEARSEVEQLAQQLAAAEGRLTEAAAQVEAVAGAARAAAEARSAAEAAVAAAEAALQDAIGRLDELG